MEAQESVAIGAQVVSLALNKPRMQFYLH